MNTKLLITTLALGVLASVVGVQVIKSNEGQSEFSERSLLSLAKASIDLTQVEKIAVSNKDLSPLVQAQLVLQNWQLAELHGYEADTEQLSALLQSLSDAKVVELKTRKAENHHRLGLAELNAEEGQGTVVILSHGAETLSLMVGKTASSGVGQYVRFVSEDQTYLIDQQFDLPSKPEDWLRTEVFDLEFDQLRGLEVAHSGESFRIVRDELPIEAKEQEAELPLEDKPDYQLASNFKLVSMPEGRELEYGSILDGLVRNVLGVKAKGVMLKEAAEGFSQTHEFTLDYKLDEQAHNLQFSLLSDNGDEAKYWLSLADSKWLVQISDFDYKQITKQKEDFFQALDTEE